MWDIIFYLYLLLSGLSIAGLAFFIFILLCLLSEDGLEILAMLRILKPSN